MLLGVPLHRLHMLVMRHAYLALGDVGGIDDRLVREQKAAVHHFSFLFVKVHHAHGYPLLELFAYPIEKVCFPKILLVSALRRGARLCAPLLDSLHVGEDELVFYRLDVAQRVYTAVDMRYVLVLEAAHDVHYRVRLADMREELVAQALAVRRALDEPGDVHEFKHCRGDFFTVVKSGELIQPLVGHGDHAHVGLYRAERIVGAFRSRLSYRVEQRAFAHVGQTYDSEFHLFSFFKAALCRAARIRFSPNPAICSPELRRYGRG